jgi:hypothetical protein
MFLTYFYANSPPFYKMKKIYILLAAPLLMMACQSKTPAGETAAKTDTTKLDLPYKQEKAHDWQMNPDQHNLQAALAVIKALENNDTTAMGKVVADSVQALVDGMDFKGTRTELLKAIKEEMDKMKDVKIAMNDWESVKSADGSEEWVSLWYKQKWVDAKGKADSLDMYNDIQLKEGKMVKLVEFTRRYPLKK